MKHGGEGVNKEDELTLKITKEIVVKFIEVGKLSVNSFEAVWDQIYRVVRASGSDRPSSGG